ncbi:MAG: signal recognition particle protein [Gammaproteobacteria bacterium]|nr:signal recognition particle protein [Gammaproteobacteria bacterium]MBT4378007.1 signal recognition particle protein [Gammaproteobacteria bacterium]MBT4618101.1 signal recognition particle protein [Gammaproteobacteria bacterium]MBT5196009.1 signal recognition particle protein [Gammaproteobacteria bacterium]MBT5441550.1 signal recognition particle protein [Gammaproteobacteria bacterium]
MFESLTERLGSALSSITGKAKLTEENIQDALREVRIALLEADVALVVVKDFIESVKARALGIEVAASLSPGQGFIKIVNDELVRVMGAGEGELNLSVQPPAVILMAGLQGAGKTTSTAKLGLWLKNKSQKSVMVASTDVYRPAAIEQLRTLAEQAQINFFESNIDQKPIDIAKGALAEAKKQFADVLIIDTAGRLGIDEEMMQEIRDLHQVLTPAETLFVVDALTGQDAANTARAFGDVLPLTGVILSKADGDSRGGAALSVKSITGKPIKFMGVGETIDALDAFHPDRIASRILGMGDVMSLIEDAEQKIDKKKAEKLARKIKKGKKFDLEDFKDQIQQMNNMGGIASMLDKMPGMGKVSQAAQEKINDKSFIQMEAIINSMTPGERHYPDSINGSRKKRIAGGSGTQIQDINRLLKQHKQMQKMMKKLGKKGGMTNMMRGMGGMMQPPGGGFPGR